MSHPDDLLPCPSTYVRLLLQRWPAQAPELLAGTGLSADQLRGGATLRVREQLQVFRNVQALDGRPDWGLRFGRELNINSHGPVGFAALSAPTLGEGLDVLSRFARIRAPYLDFATTEEDGWLLLCIDSARYPLGALTLPLLDCIAQIAVSFVEAVLGRDTVDIVVQRRHPRPAHASDYARWLAARCEFGAARDAIGVPATLRSLPCPLSDDKAYRGALLRCREALDAVLLPDDVMVRASHWLAARFDEIGARGRLAGLPRADELAAALCLSPRTLARRLAARGTSFGALRSAQQLDCARQLLADARYTVAEIGLLLGYGDAANFGRAFRRLTGQAPGQFRRQARLD